MKVFFSLLLATSLWVWGASPAIAESRVRRVAVQPDQIVTVRTALGIATIIQVPDSPNSVVVGDQGAFKVEYLDRAITIKPLNARAKSNLYIYTEWKRYNVQLLAGAEQASDYIVYLDEPRRPSSSGGPGIIWTKFSSGIRDESIHLVVARLGRSRNGSLLIEFSIHGDKGEPFRADWLWITQGGVVCPIQSLFLSSAEVKPGRSISGTIHLLRSDVRPDLPLRIELRRKRTVSILIPKAAAWK